jgi:hypothetical protein
MPLAAIVDLLPGRDARVSVDAAWLEERSGADAGGRRSVMGVLSCRLASQGAAGGAA